MSETHLLINHVSTSANCEAFMFIQTTPSNTSEYSLHMRRQRHRDHCSKLDSWALCDQGYFETKHTCLKNKNKKPLPYVGFCFVVA